MQTCYNPTMKKPKPFFGGKLSMAQYFRYLYPMLKLRADVKIVHGVGPVAYYPKVKAKK
jgi:hypothetical protein